MVKIKLLVGKRREKASSIKLVPLSTSIRSAAAAAAAAGQDQISTHSADL
jgi:hypothetical protein